MNMMKMNIKRRRKTALLLLTAFLILLAGNLWIRHSSGPRLETFQLEEGGWGYQITINKKRLIYQPTITAYDRSVSFPDETSARAVGQLVLERINKKENFSVSKEEVYAKLTSKPESCK